MPVGNNSKEKFNLNTSALHAGQEDIKADIDRALQNPSPAKALCDDEMRDLRWK